MVREVDARGLPCPRPVVETRKALQEIEDGTITVLVDRPDACYNVQRYATSQGCTVDIEEGDGISRLTITKGQSVKAQSVQSSNIVLVCSDQFGTGDAVLGEKLMKSFLNTLRDSEPKPTKLIFVNAGVTLTTEGSQVLDILEILEKDGIQIYSCGTCLEHYNLVEKLKIGLVTNMYDIVDSSLNADKVVRI